MRFKVKFPSTTPMSEFVVDAENEAQAFEFALEDLCRRHDAEERRTISFEQAIIEAITGDE